MVFHLPLVSLAILATGFSQQSYKCSRKDKHSTYTTVFRLMLYKSIDFYSECTYLLLYLYLNIRFVTAKIVDNIILLPNKYKEQEDIVMLRVREKEIEVFPEIIQIKIKLKRYRRKGRRKYTHILRLHLAPKL